ncbi:peptidoglycan editing factor PgeF [Candidatus Pelagibacter bacterium]|jgi:polyphenol oxidase|nr:peptidoglycan editing factor PgeF [Candidatus Pelagibacter bacterium]
MFYSKKLNKFDRIKHCFFSKKGGFSTGLYKSLNCGVGSKDKKRNVFKNLNYVSQKMGVKKKQLILMSQSHSNEVIEIKKSNYNKKISCDAMITRVKGLSLCVLTADCVPIIIYDLKNDIIGCIHAGWKGALSGIIKNTVKKLKKLNSDNILFASVGPCIGKESYEIDLNFYKKFILRSKKNKKYFSKIKKDKRFFDLRSFVADKLKELKVKVDHVNHNTFKEKSNFFSYRRSCKLKQIDYGRCISVIRLI